ncbi:MAG: YggS family pyridoxal phosphate-dependent enzyme [Deltaproteobacteria bacterium]|nr:YggS family pyridoxal phosphate-dependent enzyme [Deltaproteobacteria bacterium]MBW1962604.1 YggS family pyridoxal phosphate-dependent enzyme [Deltaproteobacteria bacterium]MBW1993779.1 YggS family pyridoxal phosphate-dependent enzyme [Deltaproteobacteria bacterium]MBW2154633.1 YggS family pyridoxal phosphate-dependent enzyme [Deltaproteobacteria bacterium]
MHEIKDRLKEVKERIRKAALACGRDPLSVKLVAVSKTMPVEKIRCAIEAGVTILGENYVQEARKKIDALSSYPVSWHFIGHLQTNKAKYAVRLFDLIHSVDSEKLAREIDRQAKKANKIQQVLIQVNIGKDPAKSGTAAENTIRLLREICHLENISVQGLMTMPPFFDDPEKVRPYFVAMSELRDQIRQENIPNISMDELSMGMTGDFEVAIECGATLVRIGTAIFGKRN